MNVGVVDVQPFGQRLREAVAAYGPVVAGFDPHASVLEAWGLEDTAAGAEALCDGMLEACVGKVAAIKPQSAFFERFGSAGIQVLERLLANARAEGVLTILDVKRGDIGSTMSAYARAYLEPGAPLEADAITVSPYLGFGSLDSCIPYLRERGKGLYILVLTSNPDGPQVQHATTSNGVSVAAAMLSDAHRVNRECGMASGWGSVGAVVGATIGDAAQRLGVDLGGFNGTFLAPGFGAQGAGPKEKSHVFGDADSRVLVSMSRSLLLAGPTVSKVQLALDKAREDYASGQVLDK